MHQHKSWLLITALLLAVCPLTVLADYPLFEPERWGTAELQKHLPSLLQGGYVIYFRHMASNHEQEDQRPVDLKDCSTQRQLSAKGRGQAVAIGKAMKKIKLPIGKVISSPFCRCKDSARLAFGYFKTSADLYFAMGLSREGKNDKGRALRKMFGTPPNKGTNTIIVAHTANLQEAVGLWPKPEGVAYIFQPTGKGEFKAIGKLKPETWQKFSQ